MRLGVARDRVSVRSGLGARCVSFTRFDASSSCVSAAAGRPPPLVPVVSLVVVCVQRRAIGGFRRPLHNAAVTAVAASSSLSWGATPGLFVARRGAASFGDIAKACSLLGVSVDTDPKELKSKYRELVKKHHPDTGGSEEMMKQLGVALQTLQGLSRREKQEFAQQGRGGGSGGAAAYSTPRPRGHSKFHGGGAGGAGGGGGYGYQTAYDYQQAQQHRRQRTYAQYGYRDESGNQAFHRHQNMYNPFSSRGTAQSFEDLFSGRAGGAGAPGRMITRGQIMTMLTVYFVVFMVFTTVYRRYSDWKQTEGWQQAERLARHEQLEELAQVRQELREKIRRQAIEYNERRRGGGGSEASKERRAFEYAEQRAMQQALRGWPAFDPALGQLMRHPMDPLGIVYFEPYFPTAATAPTKSPLPDGGAQGAHPEIAGPATSAYAGTYGVTPDLVRGASTVGVAPGAGAAGAGGNGSSAASSGAGTTHPSRRRYELGPELGSVTWPPPPPGDARRDSGGGDSSGGADPTRPALNWNQMTVQQQRLMMEAEERRRNELLHQQRHGA